MQKKLFLCCHPSCIPWSKLDQKQTAMWLCRPFVDIWRWHSHELATVPAKLTVVATRLRWLCQGFCEPLYLMRFVNISQSTEVFLIRPVWLHDLPSTLNHMIKWKVHQAKARGERANRALSRILLPEENRLYSLKGADKRLQVLRRNSRPTSTRTSNRPNTTLQKLGKGSSR
ncbi:hypothetical protein C8J56DRAFT_113943 [Mycena floridula]|nr:hypothetical protein C8J56DRAFT_113943 [Mycena floridula]